MKNIISLGIIILSFVFIFSAAMADEQRTIVAFGDSLVAGYGVIAEENFPSQLQKALAEEKFNVRVFNAGISGETTAGGKARVAELLAFKPDIVIISLGYNDMLRGIYPDQVHANLEYIVRTLTQNGIKVIICGAKAPPDKKVLYANQFNSIFEDVADAYDTEFYPSFLEGVYGDRSKTIYDGVHPNAEGIKVMVNGVLPKVKKLL